jgi:hypothetical protein
MEDFTELFDPKKVGGKDRLSARDADMPRVVLKNLLEDFGWGHRYRRAVVEAITPTATHRATGNPHEDGRRTGEESLTLNCLKQGQSA